jgi:AmmeMemoRadiSam system protein A
MNMQGDVPEEFLENLSEVDGVKLRDIAITAIRSNLSGMAYHPRIDDPVLKKKAGVFVTLKNRGELRGCIGYIYPTYEIWDATRRAAVLAASEDPRFRSVSKSELDNIEVEITVLGSMEPMKSKDIQNLKIGKEGLMVVSPVTSGILLPQVATENGFGPLEFLEATCEKAGLSPNAWKDSSVSIYKFSAVVL